MYGYSELKPGTSYVMFICKRHSVPLIADCEHAFSLLLKRVYLRRGGGNCCRQNDVHRHPMCRNVCSQQLMLEQPSIPSINAVRRFFLLMRDDCVWAAVIALKLWCRRWHRPMATAVYALQTIRTVASISGIWRFVSQHGGRVCELRACDWLAGFRHFTRFQVLLQACSLC